MWFKKNGFTLAFLGKSASGLTFSGLDISFTEKGKKKKKVETPLVSLAFGDSIERLMGWRG